MGLNLVVGALVGVFSVGVVHPNERVLAVKVSTAERGLALNTQLVGVKDRTDKVGIVNGGRCHGDKLRAEAGVQDIGKLKFSRFTTLKDNISKIHPAVGSRRSYDSHRIDEFNTDGACAKCGTRPSCVDERKIYSWVSADRNHINPPQNYSGPIGTYKCLPSNLCLSGDEVVLPAEQLQLNEESERLEKAQDRQGDLESEGSRIDRIAVTFVLIFCCYVSFALWWALNKNMERSRRLTWLYYCFSAVLAGSWLWFCASMFQWCGMGK